MVALCQDDMPRTGGPFLSAIVVDCHPKSVEMNPTTSPNRAFIDARRGLWIGFYTVGCCEAVRWLFAAGNQRRTTAIIAQVIARVSRGRMPYFRVSPIRMGLRKS